MCLDEPSPHTDSDHDQADDPHTVVRMLRHVTAALSAVLALVSAPFIFAGASGHDVRWLNTGLTLLGLAGMALSVSAGAHMSLQRGRQEGDRYYVLKDAEAELKDALAEIKGMLTALNTRIDGLEAGQRHIIHAFQARVEEEEGEQREGECGVSRMHPS